jgi:hypothetical protein
MFAGKRYSSSGKVKGIDADMSIKLPTAQRQEQSRNSLNI